MADSPGEGRDASASPNAPANGAQRAVSVTKRAAKGLADDVKSEFQDVAGYDPKWVQGVWERIGPVLAPQDVARMVTFIASQPAGVHVSDLLVRPTRQDYP